MFYYIHVEISREIILKPNLFISSINFIYFFINVNNFIFIFSHTNFFYNQFYVKLLLLKKRELIALFQKSNIVSIKFLNSDKIIMLSDVNTEVRGGIYVPFYFGESSIFWTKFLNYLKKIMLK